MLDVIICGNIRAELSAAQVFREIDLARCDGLVRKIVFSTWRSEGERFPQLFDALAGQGVDIVMLDPPQPYSGTMPIQHLQFWRGVQALGDEPAFVYRTRTDKSFGQTVEFFSRLRRGEIDLEGEPRPKSLLDRRIHVHGVSMNEPFAHNDLTFAIWKNDCRRILNFDAAFDYIFKDRGYFPVEACWFVNPVLTAHPELKAFFERVNIPRLAAAVRHAASQRELPTAPDSVFAFLLGYWRIAADLFAVSDKTAYSDLPQIDDVLSPALMRPWTFNWGDRVLVTSQMFLTALGEGRLEQDRLWPRFAPHVSVSHDFSAALGACDPDALNSFIESRLGPVQAPYAPPILRGQPNAAPGGLFLAAAQAMTSISPFPGQEEILGRIEAGIERERESNQGNWALLEIGLELENQARLSGDASHAQLAHLCFKAAALQWVPEAVDASCALAFDGFLTAAERKVAFELVYPIYARQIDSKIGKFWFGIDHVFGLRAPLDKDFGMRLVREAADLGFARALDFLENQREPAPPAAG